MAESDRKQAQILHTVFVNATKQTGPIMSDATLNFSDNLEMDMGLMEESDIESEQCGGGGLQLCLVA